MEEGKGRLFTFSQLAGTLKTAQLGSTCDLNFVIYVRRVGCWLDSLLLLVNYDFTICISVKRGGKEVILNYYE